MGAGRIVYQDLTKITKAIQDGDFFENPALIKAMDGAKKSGKKLHLYGLLSDGGVHSHITHVYALLEMAKKRGLKEVFVHCFMDGRDVSPTSGAGFVKELQAKMKEIGIGKVASVCGRYYAMDRDNNWDRIEQAYDMLTLGTGVQCTNPVNAIEESYKAGVTDEFIKPTKVFRCGKPAYRKGRQRNLLQLPPRPRKADYPRRIAARICRTQGHGVREKDGLSGARVRMLYRIRRNF